MYVRRKKQVVGEMMNAHRYWQDQYFYMLVNEKSLGALANALYTLWGPFYKELRKPLPKALLFEAKLKRLLAQPNREWNEINMSHRFRQSTLWKDFVEIPSLEKKVAKVAEATKTAEAARVLAGEKPVKKAVGKRKREQYKVVALKLSSKLQAVEEEEADIEVNLPPGTSLLQNEEITV
ncbi:hypothetical protein TIFTF001_033183 [Ficus carica]|uniref:Uncharacterized protein n=1 Tax=Ficus carica TaxID=3494 RepID=A0AA88J6T1_FICCA|nr:hypothetical protein TIFTF001_033183 [Ficus carica]